MRLEKILHGFSKGITIAGLAASSLFFSCSENPVTNPAPTPSPVKQNKPPIILSLPPTSVIENQNYNYQVQASDADKDTLKYSLAKNPSWLSISNSGLISGMAPEVAGNENHEVIVTVSDGKASVQQNYNLIVQNLFNTYVLSPIQTSELVNVDSTSLSFSQPMNFSQGDIVSSGISAITPNGFLLEVASVSSDKKIFQTSQATLEQVVKNASLSYSGKLLPSQVGSFSGLEGTIMSKISSGQGFDFNIELKDIVLFDYDHNPNTKGDQLLANGKISFNTNTIFNLNISNHQLNNLTFRNLTNMNSDISIGFNLLGFAQTYQIKVAEYKFQPFVAGYLPTPIPIPVIFVPKLGVYVGIDPAKLNPVSVRVQGNADLDAGFFYNGTWTSSSTFSKEFTYSNPVVGGDLEFKVYAGPQLEIMLYGIAGPFASINGKLRVKVQDEGWEVYGGWGVSLGVKMEVLKRGGSIKFAQVINHEELLAKSQTPPPQLSSGKIVFERTVDNNTDIYVMDSDGSNQTNLTNNSAWDIHPTWSPDGGKIAFVSDREGNRQIYIINADGSNPVKVTSNIYAETPDWSPDGGKMTFARYFGGSSRDIYTMDVDGSSQKNLTNDSQSYSPSWSQDGSKIAFTGWDGDYEIYVIDRDGKNRTQLTNNGFLKWDKFPSWSPDGTKIAFSSDMDNSSSDADIYVMNSDGSDQINLTNTPNAGDSYPSWSQDSKKIIYVSGTGTDAEIWIMNQDGTGKTKVTNNNYEDTRPRWSR